MKRLPMLLLLLGAGASGYGFYCQHRAQVQLNAQLYKLHQLLDFDNEDAARRMDNAVRGMEAAVIKNQNQPREVAILAAVRALDSQADSLAQVLRGLATTLRRATSNTEPLVSLAHLGETGAAEKLLGPTGTARRGLQQQLAEYRSVLRALNPNGKAVIAAPSFGGLPVVAALAGLSQMESEVRAAESSTLQHLTPQVGAKRLRSHLAAFSSAESTTMAPGETYRAQLFLAPVFDLRHVNAQMRRDGQLVPVDSGSIGQVRFRAPSTPGPATWTGTIRLHVNGRDTTFRVRVPYRVVRR